MKPFPEALRTAIHNALIDGPRLESDEQSELNRLIELIHDRVTETLLQHAGKAVAYTSREQLYKASRYPGNNHVMWGEPLPYHNDIPLYEVPRLDLLNEMVDAWEALPGGRQVKNSDVEAWLGRDMGPMINKIREALNRPKPKV